MSKTTVVEDEYLNSVSFKGEEATWQQMFPKGKKGATSVSGSKVSAKDTSDQPAVISQEKFAREDTLLPAHISDEMKEYLKEQGFIYKKPVTHNRLLAEWTFPKGWRKLPTGRVADSRLVDSRGYTHAIIVYKPTGNSQEASIEISK